MLGLQQSCITLILCFSDLNSYPKGDFYPVFHTLLQHKCLLLVALQVTYKEKRVLPSPFVLCSGQIYVARGDQDSVGSSRG